MFTHPGTKLLFMGGEFGPTSEWKHDISLDWHLLQYDFHKGVLALIQDINTVYKTEPALYRFAFEERGFEWVDYNDRENSVMVYMRKAERKEDTLVVICNFTPEVRHHYRIGVNTRGTWKEIFNSDNVKYGGSGLLNQTLLQTSPVRSHGRDYSISVSLPPLGVSVIKLEQELIEFELGS
jgi:1,4-alpha-glucan branching enzyme